MSHPPGLCIWFTGLACSGKTTLANVLAGELEHDHRVSVLDADVVRPRLCPDLGFAPADRRASMLRIAFVARQLVNAGAVVLVTTIGPHDEHRKAVREQFEPDTFAQVYARASLETCERRDVKNMYKRARQGDLPLFTGIGSAYEEPADSEVVCFTDHESVSQSIKRILTAECVRAALNRIARDQTQLLPSV
jgi:adenylyl-sulfate kinase